MMDSQETREFAAQHSASVSKHHGTQSQLRHAPPLETLLPVESQVLANRTGALRSPDSTNLVLAQDTLSLSMPHVVSYVPLLQKLSHILVTAAEPEVILQKITQTLGQAFEADCYLAVCPNSQFLPHSIYWWQAAEDIVVYQPQARLAKHPALKTILGSSSTELCNISDLAAIPCETGAKNQWDGPSVRALLGSTTQFHGQQNGVIGLVRSQAHHWTATEMANLNGVLPQVAIAISQFYTQHQIQQQNCRQALIEQLTVAVRNALELNQILKLATEGAAQALQVDRSLLLMLKYSDPMVKSRSLERSLRVKASVVCEWLNPTPNSHNQSPGLAPVLNEGFWIPECALSQQAFSDPSKLVVVTNGYESYLTAPPEAVASVFAPETFPALVMVPLESQGTILGFLVLQHSQPRNWEPEELKLLELVGAQVSTAIIQSQTLRQVQALVEERTAQLKRSLEVQAKLYERTRKQIDQLRQLNQLKDEFLSTMSHELLTPLTSMTLAIRMLRQAELSPERQNKYLDILEQQCNQETNLINDLLALQKLESNQASVYLQKVDFKSLIGELVESFEERLASKGLTLTTDLPKRSLILQTDYDSLNRILVELLTNAGKYAEPNSIIHLVVAHPSESSNNQIVLTLCNTGPGIAEEELPYIFDKFRRGQGVTQRAVQGTGLGLALVKCLVQHLNGAIAVASHPLPATDSCETCFTLTLPHTFNSANP
ncbi:GAF domain-containing sensor histidine kinase [Trichocoleus sp. FACHB-591]|uniref:sensor histidine kinase n=1 Tax=Trichocoleus sp. FACHB-591 TaxID=2692872 RepID=UPI001685144B|nr:GAF domain-containing sensor histidine kinase [Trichocoleus sp. FACHB-591]MBD2098961.1 GAF domain-containing sensor histidine kinase [Trichocoleus sp. FACHB-591]